MGGTLATRLLCEQPDSFIGGGFLFADRSSKTNDENFLLYAKQVLERNGKETTEEKSKVIVR